jgi:Fe-S-cluster-containing dehydrogenase component
MRRLALEPAPAGGAEPERRHFLKLLGASIALAGATACSGPPPEQIVPWIRKPERMTPSIPQLYATRCAGDVLGVLVETHEGRPTKIEGNPLHPASLGATNAWAQAAVLELWDPNRSQAIQHQGSIASWDDFLAAVSDSRTQWQSAGDGLHVLSGRIDSPTLAAQRHRLLSQYPGSRWYEFEAIDDANALQGAQLAFGKPLRSRYRFDRADVIVSLEADFLGTFPGHVRYARDFSEKRNPDSTGASPTRLYVLEPSPSLTGMRADHRWPVASGDLQHFATLLSASLGLNERQGGTPPTQRWSQIVNAIAEDLRAHPGRSLVLAGPYQPPFVHALTHLMNQRLGNWSHTVEYFESTDSTPTQIGSLPSLVESIDAGKVKTLLILDGNPVYAAPADLRFGEKLAKAGRTFHLGLYRDETAQKSTWHLPATHALETWSDTRGYDGTASIVQPVIAPLYGGHPVHQVLSAFLGEEPVQDDLSRVRATWPNLSRPEAWERALQQGVIEQTTPPALDVQSSALLSSEPTSFHGDETESLELLFRPDATVWDGRYANNAWLQELPKPVTQLTWSNAVLLSPTLAARWKLRNGDRIILRLNSEAVEAPVWLVPGQAHSSVVLSLGYGHTQTGQLSDSLGFNAFRLQTSHARWIATGVSIQPAGRHTQLASTAEHHPIEESGTDAVPAKISLRSLYGERHPREYQWGMTIDLNSCIGCSACTIACQAENNIPVVGPEQVAWGREMHWIRIDPHVEGPPESPRFHHQPVPCMHCSHAPCEVVCPVGATVHDSEGLNLQVYNRCVGTRFCSNNCPYKVRRFNFLQYSDLETESLKAQRNPEVSVRNRGVMEKCTYCIQRIEAAHINSDREGRRIADGEIVTACQAVCPTKAITFGDTSVSSTAVSQAKRSQRNYALLQELNTRPQTTYLTDARNPNPALKDAT